MAERIAAEATVVSARSVGRHAQDVEGESYWWQDLGSAAFGKTRWALVLDIRPPGAAPYRADVQTKLPNRLFGIRGFLDGSTGIAPGLVLPVRIDPGDPGDVTVDWKGFEGRTGAREEMRGAEDAKRSGQATAAFAAKLREDPKRFERNRALVLDAARSVADGVRAGTHRPKDLEAVLATNVPIGLISPEEADAFWRSATDPET